MAIFDSVGFYSFKVFSIFGTTQNQFLRLDFLLPINYFGFGKSEESTENNSSAFTVELMHFTIQLIIIHHEVGMKLSNCSILNSIKFNKFYIKSFQCSKSSCRKKTMHILLFYTFYGERERASEREKEIERKGKEIEIKRYQYRIIIVLL